LPDNQEYLNRIRNLVGREDPLAIQAGTASKIAGLIANLPELRLRGRPSPQKWAIIEIIAHLAEDELVASWRYRQMLESSGCVLAGFDQDKWSAYGRYDEWNAEDAVVMFSLLRDANLRLLRRLNDEEWAQFGVHAERGPLTIRDLATHMAGHDLNHVQQIRTLVNGSAET